MKVTEEKKGNTAVFSLEGRLDSTSSPDVEKKILEAIEQNIPNIVLDFSDVEYLSSAGIRVLVHCHKEIEKHQGKIVLCSVPAPIENILYITGFLPYFKVFDNKQAALSSFS